MLQTAEPLCFALPLPPFCAGFPACENRFSPYQKVDFPYVQKGAFYD